MHGLSEIQNGPRPRDEGANVILIKTSISVHYSAEDSWNAIPGPGFEVGFMDDDGGMRRTVKNEVMRAEERGEEMGAGGGGA